MGVYEYILKNKCNELAEKEFLKLSKEDMLEQFLVYDDKEFVKKIIMTIILFTLSIALLAMFIELLMCCQ